MFKKTLLAFVTIAGSFSSVHAIEPLKDRAVVQRMNAELLLPDNSTINVDVNFDCGSDYKDTALIVMNDAGAKIIAAAYTNLYGIEYGNKIIDAWENKKAPDDPRKPTYLFIIAPRNQAINWNGSAKRSFNKKKPRDNMSFVNGIQNEVPPLNEFIPQIIAGCGVRDDHDPNEARSVN
jgi:hypothetical protein